MRRPLPTLAVLALALATAGVPAVADARAATSHAKASNRHRGKSAGRPATSPASQRGQADGGSLYVTPTAPRTRAAGAATTVSATNGGTAVVQQTGPTGPTGPSGASATATGTPSLSGGATVPASPASPTGATGATGPTGPAGPTATGSRAWILASGLAQAPANAPAAVSAAIAAGNQLIGQPYVYGGGHKSFVSDGYDCSGAVSFALHGANLLAAPLDSGSLELWGAAGAGAWITVYTNPAHAYVDIAGIRLDTSTAGDPGGRSGPRWRPLLKSNKGFLARHFAGL